MRGVAPAPYKKLSFLTSSCRIVTHFLYRGIEKLDATARCLSPIDGYAVRAQPMVALLSPLLPIGND